MRTAGATDIETHDAVLIAAAFRMYNRYLDGLATWQPIDVRHRFLTSSCSHDGRGASLLWACRMNPSACE